MNHSFFMFMKPPTTTQQQKNVSCKSGKPIFYEDDELKKTRQDFMIRLNKNKPERILEGSIRLVTKWCYPISGNHKDGEWKDTKPDTDNMIKLLKDCMEKTGFFKNDSQVASEITEKFWADVPGIYIYLEELNDVD